MNNQKLANRWRQMGVTSEFIDSLRLGNKLNERPDRGPSKSLFELIILKDDIKEALLNLDEGCRYLNCNKAQLFHYKAILAKEFPGEFPIWKKVNILDQAKFLVPEFQNAGSFSEVAKIFNVTVKTAMLWYDKLHKHGLLDEPPKKKDIVRLRTLTFASEVKHEYEKNHGCIDTVAKMMNITPRRIAIGLATYERATGEYISRRPIIVIYGVEFRTYQEAADAHGITQAGIRQRIRKKYRGYKLIDPYTGEQVMPKTLSTSMPCCQPTKGHVNKKIAMSLRQFYAAKRL